MHAGFPSFNTELQQIFRLGAQEIHLPKLAEKLGGPVVAQSIASILELGFVYIMRDAIVDANHAKNAMQFFNDNFVITDPYARGGQRYYQGKFLLRTKKAGDNMNVHLHFCKQPDELFCDTPFGTSINPLKIVSTRVLNEKEADQIERDPEQVDLVIRFRDLASIINLLGEEQVDIVGLLLDNVVQLTGNVGHLFKLGAIAKEIELAIGLNKAQQH